MFPVIHTYIVGKIIQIVKHSETEGDHQDQDGRSDEQNKQTVEQRGMVGMKSGADDQSVSPPGQEGEASQNEQQTG